MLLSPFSKQKLQFMHLTYLITTAPEAFFPLAITVTSSLKNNPIVILKYEAWIIPLSLLETFLSFYLFILMNVV